jgi:magnesium chelatase subunit H
MRGRAADPHGHAGHDEARDGPMKLLKKLRGSKEPGQFRRKADEAAAPFAQDPEVHPGKAQDLRAWFLTMQYWLGGSDDNVEQMVRFLVGTYAHDARFKGAKARRRSITPIPGSITPICPGITHHRCDRSAEPGKPGGDRRPDDDAELRAVGRRGALRRGDPADAGGGACAIPAFAGGLDGRPRFPRTFRAGASMRWCR